MGQVTVTVNARPYVVGCEDGQEAHVERLAKAFDEQVREVGRQVGNVGELRLFLMAALVASDEVLDARARLAESQTRLEQGQTTAQGGEARAIAALDSAAARIEALTASLD
jgi:cell division protein ZapA